MNLEIRENELKHAIAIKLGPGRFSSVSGRQFACLGALLNTKYTDPRLASIIATSDGMLLGRNNGDVGFNEVIGTFADFERNTLWNGGSCWRSYRSRVHVFENTAGSSEEWDRNQCWIYLDGSINRRVGIQPELITPSMSEEQKPDAILHIVRMGGMQITDVHDKQVEGAQAIMRLAGPYIEVELACAYEDVQRLEKEGGIVPQPMRGIGLIDTGASHTGLSPRALEHFAFESVGEVSEAHGTTKAQPRKQYAFAIDIPSISIQREIIGSVFESAEQSVIAIIGRDIISDLYVLFNGPAGEIHLVNPNGRRLSANINLEDMEDEDLPQS